MLMFANTIGPMAQLVDQLTHHPLVCPTRRLNTGLSKLIVL